MIKTLSTYKAQRYMLLFSRRAVDRSATVTIRLIEADVRLEGGSLPLDWPADFAEAHVYKLSSTNGITGTLRLKQSEFATHTYNLTHQKVIIH